MSVITRRRFIIGGLGLVSATVLADALWYEKRYIELTEHFLGEAKPSSSNIRLLQVSDLHLRRIKPLHYDLATEINKLRPDMLLFTGDVIDRNSNLPRLDHFLSLLDPAIQKVAILGNWECWQVHPLELQKVYERHQCMLIVNHSYKYNFEGTSISITGIDDLIGGKADFPMAMESFRPADYHLVLTHCPAHCDLIQKQMGTIPIDLVLSGHTHGGQVCLFGFAPARPAGSGRYVSGWYTDKVPHLYVSRGIGTSALPIRFGSRAEISLFNLKKKTSSANQSNQPS